MSLAYVPSGAMERFVRAPGRAAWSGGLTDLIFDRAQPRPIQVAALCSVLFAVLAVVLLRDVRFGHFFTEDYAVYLQQTLNIVHGRPLSDLGTHYWFDATRDLSSQSPASYPPLTGALYALPVSLFGLDLEAVKVFQVLLAAAGATAMGLLLLSDGCVIGAVALSLFLFALSPDMARAVNAIGSDLPFLLVLAITIATIDAFTRARSRRGLMGWGAAVGASLALALLCRTVAVALLPALVMSDVQRHRRVRYWLCLPVVVLAALWVVQDRLLGMPSAYQFVLHYPFLVPGAVLRDLVWSWEIAYGGSAYGRLMLPALFLLGVFAAIGVAEHARRGAPLALFLISYSAVLLVLPNFGAGLRYVMPHLLVGGAYACHGAAHVLSRLRLNSRIGFAAAFPALLLTAGVPAAAAGALPFGVHTQDTQVMIKAVETIVPIGGIVAASPSRSFHLFTGRRTITLPYKMSPADFTSWLHDNGVGYVVLRTSPDPVHYDFTDCPGSLLCGPGAATYGFAVARREAGWILLARAPASSTLAAGMDRTPLDLDEEAQRAH